MSFTFAEAVERLYSIMYRGLAPEAMHKPDEGRPMRAAKVLARFGDPQRQYRTIHVTGTKGKGSVSTMIAGILQAAGYRVGLLTSPHLQDIRERIQVDRSMIPEEAFAALVEDSWPVFEALPTARFPECLNAIAFRWFQRSQVDFAVIEVGVGGRLDATNVLTPELAVFTSISFDHMHLLGNTLAAIAGEKAGIIKPGCTVVSAPQAAEAQAVIAERASALGCPFIAVGRDVRFTPAAPDAAGQRVTIEDEDRNEGRDKGAVTYQVGLLGEHQAVNAAVAVGAVRALRARGVTIPPEAVRAGLRAVFWPGRFELAADDPLLILDGAHNGESALRLRQTVQALYAGWRVVLVYGAKAHKDVIGTLAELVPIADSVVLTRASDAIAQPPDALLPYPAQAGYHGPVQAAPTLADALALARAAAQPDGLLLLTGSLYLVGDARTLLGLAPNQPRAKMA